MNDLISSYPVIPQPGCRQQFNEQPYANSMAIRLIPSMYQMKKKNNNNNNNNKYEITDKYLKYPPVEIQAQLDRGQILHYTLQVLSLEAVKMSPFHYLNYLVIFKYQDYYSVVYYP